MYGSTYNGHPVPVASAYATIKYMLENKVIENAAAMETHMTVSVAGKIEYSHNNTIHIPSFFVRSFSHQFREQSELTW